MKCLEILYSVVLCKSTSNTTTTTTPTTTTTNDDDDNNNLGRVISYMQIHRLLSNCNGIYF